MLNYYWKLFVGVGGVWFNIFFIFLRSFNIFLCRVIVFDVLCRCIYIIIELLFVGVVYNIFFIYLYVGVRNGLLIVCYDFYCSFWDGCCYVCDELFWGYRDMYK